MREELKREFEESIRAKRDRKADTVSGLEQVTNMKLSELSRRNIALQVYSEILGCEIWLCSNSEMVSQIKHDNPGAVIYTVDELRKIIRLNPSSEEVRAIHNTKSVFDGSKVIDSKFQGGSNESKESRAIFRDLGNNQKE